MYKPAYKCQLCGQYFKRNHHDTDMIKAYAQMLHATLGADLSIAPVERCIPHMCEDGSIGVADFIGYVYEEDNPGA